MNFPTAAVSASQAAGAVPNRPLVLNEGQMVHGQIKQLYPGQMAEVQIGGQKVFAKLEIPMRAGDSYYFQVNAVKPELQLKIISGPLQATEGQARQLGGLMDAMQLPKTPEMQALLAFVMKNKIPMTRDSLLEAETLLKGVPPAARNEALASLQKMIELKLPLTENIFRSLLGVETKEGLHSVLTSLRNALALDNTVTSQVKDAILSALEKMAKPFAQVTGGALLGQSILTLLDRSAPGEDRFATLQMLKSAGVLPERTSLANLPQVLASLISGEGVARSNALTASQSVLAGPQDVPVTTMNRQAAIKPQAPLASIPIVQQVLTMLKQIGEAPPAQQKVPMENLKTLISSDPGTNAQQKTVLTAMIDRAVNAQPIAQSPTKFVQEFSQAYTRITAENAAVTPFQTSTLAEGHKEQLLTLLGQQGTEKLAVLLQTAERSDNPAIQKTVQAAEVAVASMIDGKALKDALQTVIRSFGLNYEAGLLGKEPDFGRLAEMLKPQLLALMHDPSVSAALRDAAETVVTRMNGQLLQSGENGVQHQLIMQVPLEFFGKRIDATLQWNGQMQKDGKIDADYARILFYLELDSINKTIIDMQVQNRVVMVTIFNADETLKSIGGGPLQERLKVGLESTGYKLSGVFFKNFIEEEKNVQKQKKTMKIDGQGVDFRI
ncbi:hypothetical protein [Sporosarcina psychrophila]|uniref:hypothetical protein n=1 Tax=Sporosarcina psychrophila TaxID=1476 RepID=UPI00078D5BAB|nr:hypothetical protein [Sporosarcina psychrophila]AMQ07247.1 hypothetical protein AZE41_15620 [Sporosarcina psychrophila]